MTINIVIEINNNTTTTTTTLQNSLQMKTIFHLTHWLYMMS